MILQKHKQEVKSLRQQIRRTQLNNSELQKKMNDLRYLCVSMYVYMYTCVCTCTCICIYVSVCVYTCTYVYMYMYVCTSLHDVIN